MAVLFDEEEEDDDEDEEDDEDDDEGWYSCASERCVRYVLLAGKRRISEIKSSRPRRKLE